jgi:hypothetical protein
MGCGTIDLVTNNPLEWTIDNDMREREHSGWIGECRVRGLEEVMADAGTSYALPHMCNHVHNVRHVASSRAWSDE